jgi:hypothetical protein
MVAPAAPKIAIPVNLVTVIVPFGLTTVLLASHMLVKFSERIFFKPTYNPKIIKAKAQSTSQKSGSIVLSFRFERL